MLILKWLVLILIVVLIGAVYLFKRHQHGGDPWDSMEDSDSRDRISEWDGSGGDSYVVEVRTVNEETPADRKAARQHRSREEDEGNQPSAVRRHAQGTSAATVETGPGQAERLEMVAPEQTEQSQLFRLHVAAPEGEVFLGPAIHQALARSGLKFGLHDLYHRVSNERGVTESVFCVANMLNPGVLDPADQEQLRTTGLALFLLLPTAIDGRKAMRDMMETSNLIATELDGEVLDDNRARLKAQTAQYMLDQASEIDRQARLAGEQ